MASTGWRLLTASNDTSEVRLAERLQALVILDFTTSNCLEYKACLRESIIIFYGYGTLLKNSSNKRCFLVVSWTLYRLQPQV